MDGYIRVSRRMGREGAGYISPDVQRDAIKRWAEYKDVEIAEWHVDEDWSGGTQERPGLERAVARSVDGETGGIVSWKIDRFSRYTEGGLRDLRRLEDAGARLAFVVEDVDTSGPMGKFVYTVMLAMAEYFLDNIKAGWRTAKERAHERGAKIGPTPFGYRRLEDSTLEEHPEHGPIVRQAFKLAGEQGLNAAVDYLHGLGIVHDEGKRKGRARTWTVTTVRRLLANRAYLGEAHYEGMTPNRTGLPILVSRAAWEAAQPEAAKGRRPARHYPLSKLAQCGDCGEAMVGGSAGPGTRTYRCRASLKSWKGERCRGVNVTASNLEDHVRRVLLDMWQAPGWEAQDDADGELAEAELELNEAETEMDNFVADAAGAAALRRVGRYDSALQARVEAVEAAQARYREAATNAARQLRVNPAELLEDATPEELGELARGGLEAIVVERGRGSLDGRVRLVPKGAPGEAGVTAAKDADGSLIEA
jgi:DNA invertase Pin-like site-specific DNA recombinase